MTTSVILASTDTTGKKLQKTLTNINPSATSTQLKTFAQGLNGLTTNTYIETNRIDRITCDTDTGSTSTTPPAKTTPTLTLQTSTATTAQIFSAMEGDEGLFEIEYTYDGDGTLSVATSYADIVATVDQDFLYVAFIGEGSTGTVTLYASEGTEYAAASVTFTITAE